MTLKELLQKLVEMKGSDLHIMAGLHPAFRVDGKLRPFTEHEKFDPQTAKELIYSVLTEEQKDNFEKNKESRYELDFSYGIPGMGRFRFNIHKQRGTIAATIRGLADRVPDLDELGLPESVKVFAKVKKGLILVTGPSGCGKSTTLAAIINEINMTRDDHVITIEDPIEYLHNSKKAYVTQREVGLDGDTLSFANALKYAFRQDPDVILIGELRDYETIVIAMTSAETGHLILGTLHTASAAQTIDRIVDVFSAEQQAQIRAQLASTLVGVISQALIPRIDGPGRCVACEVMMANPSIKKYIHAGKTESIYQTIQTSKFEGMQTMEQSFVQLCKEGKVNFDVAEPYLKGYSKYEFQQLIKERSATEVESEEKYYNQI